MSTDDNIRFTAIDGKLERLGTDNARLTADVGTIKTEVSEVRGKVDRISGGVTTVKWIFLATVAIVLLFGKSAIRDVTNQVVREHLGNRQMITQDGRLTAEKREQLAATGPENTEFYRWKWRLGTWVDPQKVITVRLQPHQPMPGIARTAEISDDGLTCIMTLSGPKEAFDKLPLPVDATVTIETSG